MGGEGGNIVSTVKKESLDDKKYHTEITHFQNDTFRSSLGLTPDPAIEVNVLDVVPVLKLGYRLVTVFLDFSSSCNDN